MGQQQLADSAETTGHLNQSVSASSGPQRMWFGMCVILFSCFAAYYNSFEGVFVYDDIDSISNNRHIRTLWPLSEAMSLPLLNVDTTTSRRPLLSLSFALNHFLFGPEPWGYHLVNLVIHMTAALLLFGIVRRTLCLEQFRDRYGGRSAGLALSVALIWSVHPLQTDSVTYIVQRAESLMGMLYLLTLYCALRGFHSRRAIYWHSAAVVACVVGVGVKEVMLTAPLVVLLYDGTFISESFRSAWRQRRKFYTALVASWSVFVILTLAGLDEVSQDFTARSPLAYALTQPGVILYYLRLSVWPDPLVLDYNFSYAESVSEILPASCVIVLLIGVSAWGLYRRRWFGFLGAWFFLILGPSSSFASLLQICVEHRMYLSLGTVVVLTVLAGDALLRRFFAGSISAYQKRVGTLMVLAAAVMLIMRTQARNHDYHSRLVMWTKNIQSAPGRESPVAHNSLGVEFFAQGESAKAIVQFRRALDIRPDSAYAHNNLGSALSALGEPVEAIIHYRRALRINPDFASAHNNLGLALSALGESAEAIFHFRRAIRLDPDYAFAHNNLGIELFALGQSAEAIAHFRRAIRVDPDYADAHANLDIARNSD